MTPNQAEHLLTPLLVRANAVHAWPHLGFVDQAAEYLVRKLELDRSDLSENCFAAKHQLELERCKWIDRRVLSFLEQFPHAIGVEVGAGLSTRFQRLSAITDWPRFAWADIDSPDVIDCADLIFPHTYNYRLVACDVLRDDWLRKTGWTSDCPLIVVVESLPGEINDLHRFLVPLIDAATQSNAPVHVILDYVSPVLQKIRKQLKSMLYGKACNVFIDGRHLLEKLDLHADVLVEKDLAADAQGPLLHRWTAKLYHRLTGKYFWGAVELRIRGRV